MNRLWNLGRSLPRLQGARFIVVGMLNAVFGYAVYLAGLGVHLAPGMALGVATAIGAVFNYFSTARYVFGHRALNRLPLFVAVYALVYIVNAGAIRLMLREGVSPALAQACLVPAIALLSFVLFRTFVFKPVRPQ